LELGVLDRRRFLARIAGAAVSWPARREMHLLGNHDNREVFARTCEAAFPDRGGPPGRRDAAPPSSPRSI